MKKKVFSVFILSCLCLLTYSQPFDEKFGKVSMAEMEMKVCPIDSSAEAVVLFDIGDTRFEYNTTENRFKLMISRHVRLKILDKNALDWANAKLNLYNEKDFEERLNSFKGFTYNILNGKIQKEKVEKSAIFREKKDENRTAVKITFPKVVEGSVIEYEYEIISDYIYNLQPWAFQYSIPVLYSKYVIGIPEYYMYNTHISGYENVSVANDLRDKSIVFITSERSGGTSFSDPTVRNQVSKSEVRYSENVRTFTAQKIPALESEAYVDNIDNYITKVNFELAWKKFPGEMRKDYALSWEDINNRLLDDVSFGKQLDRGGYLEDDLNVYLDSVKNQEEKIAKTISFIKSKIKWDESYRLYSDEGVKTAYRNGVGNSSDVNLNLVIALRVAGFVAYPIAISTRSHGLVFDWQKTVSGFNHVIAGVKLAEKMLFFDATSSNNLHSLLPEECLNGQARLIDLKNGTWVDLNPTIISRKSVYANFNIDQNAILTGRVVTSYKDYFAQNIAESIKGDDSLKRKRENISKIFNYATIDSLKVTMGDNGSADAKESYVLKLETLAQPTDEIIYLSPLMGLS